MIKLVLLLILGTFTTTSHAQTFAEWFKQKETQKKYLIQQIVALKVYSGYLQKGYRIAKNGLGSIGELQNKEYSEHKNYITSLKEVNPSIQKSRRVKDIALQIRNILNACNSAKVGLSGKYRGLVVRNPTGLFAAALVVCCSFFR